MEPFVLHPKQNEPSLFYLESWMKHIDGLSAGFTSKQGGSSQPPYSSLNCAFHVNDEPLDVIENRRRIAAALQLPFDAWVSAEQVHSNEVYVVTEQDRGRGQLTGASAIPKVDALITNVPEIWLTSFYADCVPLYFVDPIRRAVGLAHAGWKGTVQGIARRTIEAMQDTYDSRPQDILATIGPSIGACCYEVDDHVMKDVRNIADGFEADLPIYIDKEQGKSMLDLKQLNRQILMQAGILPTNIEYSLRCTSCQENYFYSHRRDLGKTGRMMSWIALERR